MEDQQISPETAKLAEKKGFREFSHTMHQSGTLVNFTCTQSLLQRWLREKYGYHICVIPTITSSWTFKSINVISEKDNDVIVGLKSVSDLPPYREVHGYDYSTYEEALEFGLREVLRSIS